MRIQRWNGVVVADGRIWGPATDGALWLIVDTGATRTMVSKRLLRLTGYDPEHASTAVPVITATRTEHWPLLRVQQITVLGEVRNDFDVIAQDLPQSARADGLLGLDFFAGKKLCFDLREGYLELT